MSNDIQALLERGEALAAEGRLEEAEAVMTAMLELDAGHPGALHFKGLRTMGAQQFADAESLFRRALERDPDNLQTLFALAMSLFAQAQLEPALAILDQSAAADPDQPHVWLHRGLLLDNLERNDEAVRSFMHGLKAMDRLGWEATEPDAQQLVRHANMVAAVALEARFDEVLAPLVGTHGPDAVARVRKGAYAFVGKEKVESEHPLLKPGLFLVPGLPTYTFFDAGAFADAGRLLAELEAIRAEAGVVAQDEVPLIQNGVPHEANTALFPRTAALLDTLDLHRIPGYSPQVALMRLPAGGGIPARYGPVNGRLTVHLVLDAPATGAVLRVGEDERAWKRGEVLIFNDAFQHEARNEGDQAVLMLSLDIWHPDLSAVEREALSLVLQAAQVFERDTP